MTTAVSTGGGNPAEVIDHVNGFIDKIFGSLPPEVPAPVLAPMSSIMGEILFLGLSGAEGADPMDVRDYADWELRRRLLGIAGVAQVTPIGGELRQFQVVLEPGAMEATGIGHQQVVAALQQANENAPGGFIESGHSEYLVRGIGRARSLQELGQVVVGRVEAAGEGAEAWLGQRVMTTPRAATGGVIHDGRDAL